MKRNYNIPRSDFKQRALDLEFTFAEVDGQKYWCEDGHYEFTEDQVERVYEVTTTLQELCIEAVSKVCANDWFSRLGISNEAAALISESWQNGDKDLYGRMDLRFDGYSPAKLLEYNADTPASLYEGSVIQWEWLQCFNPKYSQFNTIHESLIEAFRKLNYKETLYFAGLKKFDDDVALLNYVMDTAMQAGIKGQVIDISEITTDKFGFFHEGKPVHHIFKHYAWEWLEQDGIFPIMAQNGTTWLEPAWKMILSNKAILAILWEMFPNHPNLLPTFFEANQISGKFIKKPFLSREGKNISISDRPELDVEGPYEGPSIYQAFMPLPAFNAKNDVVHPVIGSWIVANESVGMGIREDKHLITQDSSCFVPHLFIPKG